MDIFGGEKKKPTVELQEKGAQRDEGTCKEERRDGSGVPTNNM